MATLHPNGNHRATLYQGKKKPRLSFWGETDKEAEAKKSAYIRSTASPDPSKPITRDSTLHEFAKVVWFPTINFVEPSTKRKYESVYTCHIRPWLGQRPIGEITPQEIQEGINQKSASGRVDNKKRPTGQPLGSKQVREILAQLRSMLELAVDRDVLTKNAANRIKGPRKPPKRVRVMKLSKALEVIDGTKGEQIHAPIVLACVFGLRRGECAAARWDHIDRQTLKWRVSEQIRPEPGGARTAAPKGQKVRTIYLTPELLEIIDQAGNHESEYICGWKGSGWMMPGKITALWGGSSAGPGRKSIVGCRGRFGMDDWHFHDLRHAAAGILHALGADFIAISAILGHSDAKTTLIYTDVGEDAIRAAMGKLGEAYTRHKSTVEHRAC